MRELTRLEEQSVIDYDREHHKPWNNMNRTRFYKFLTLEGVDVEVRTVACRYGKGHYAIRPVFMKEVHRASVFTTRMYVKDVCYHHMSGYVVDWSREGLSRVPEWQADGWFGIAYQASSHIWKIRDRPVINPEVLQQTERFKYCAWQPSCGDILDYLKVYAAHPRVELLVKSGLEFMGCKSGFVAQLEKDKRLMRFVMDNIESIKECRYGVDIIRLAYANGIELCDASNRIADRRHFRGSRLPREIDATKALAYMRGLNLKGEEAFMSAWDYCRYLRDCKELGRDLSDTKVSFPRDLKARREEIAAIKKEVERRKDAKRRKEMDKAIASVAVNLARLENVKGPFAVVLPKKEADLKKEGRSLHHCVGDGVYADKIMSGGLVIAFIRRKRNKSTPFVTVSFDVATRKVVQCYGLKNSKPAKMVMDFINGPFERAAKRIKAS